MQAGQKQLSGSQIARPPRRRQYIYYEPTVSLAIYFGFVSSLDLVYTLKCLSKIFNPDIFPEAYYGKILSQVHKKTYK